MSIQLICIGHASQKWNSRFISRAVLVPIYSLQLIILDCINVRCSERHNYCSNYQYWHQSNFQFEVDVVPLLLAVLGKWQDLKITPLVETAAHRSTFAEIMWLFHLIYFYFNIVSCHFLLLQYRQITFLNFFYNQ